MANLSLGAQDFFEKLSQFYSLKQMPQSQRDAFFDLQNKKLLGKDLAKWENYMEAIKNGTIPAELAFSGLNDGDKNSAYEHLQDWFTQLSEDDELMRDSAVEQFVNKYINDVGNTTYKSINETMAQNIANAINMNRNDFANVLNIPEKDLITLSNALLDPTKPYTTNTKTHDIFEKFLNGLYNLSYNQNAHHLIPKLPKDLQEDKLNDDEINDLNDNIAQGKPVANAIKTDIQAKIRAHKADFRVLTGIPDRDLDTLANALSTNNYQNDPAKQIFLQFLTEIEYADYDSIKDYLPDFLKRNTVNTSEIHNLISTNDTRVTMPPSGNTFDEQLQKMFEDLAQDKNLRDKVVSKAGQIGTQINNGVDKANYNEGKTKLNHKLNYNKNIFERAKDKIDSLHDSTIGKLEHRHNRHEYEKPAAKEIVGAVIKKTKPTDGMEKLFETIKAVQGSVSQKSREDMEWGIKELEKLSGGKYFKEALRNGRDMRQMIQQIAVDAVHHNKIESAKVLLEVLAVMRYDATSSSVRDNLRKAEFKIFSGTSLAGENAFMGNMMGALDKTLRFAALGMFEIANMAKNKYKTSGKTVTKDRLEKHVKDSDEYRNEQDKVEDLLMFWDCVTSGKKYQQQQHQQLPQNAVAWHLGR